jgi:hypothetical protein
MTKVLRSYVKQIIYKFLVRTSFQCAGNDRRPKKACLYTGRFVRRTRGLELQSDAVALRTVRVRATVSALRPFTPQVLTERYAVPVHDGVHLAGCKCRRFADDSCRWQ